MKFLGDSHLAIDAGFGDFRNIFYHFLMIKNGFRTKALSKSC
ncbi:hypothetical protein PAECIP111893_01534 [Paenibacillus plantiphilus]|uniref:Uncharacterized protein n=1 Tax=Paenibacillus plantiphilus TaxID=2905650 RepID=A0ABM9C3A1_9BACL|nr:hypothetical protein PAECIP111893_01534 [Paenibacillus plantiphilus]